MRRSIAAGLMTIVWLTLSSTDSGYAAFPQRTCSSTTWSSQVPVDIGSHEFDKDISPDGNGAQNYGKNEWFKWTLAINSNVALLNPHLYNFNTEAGYDQLIINSTSMSGNLASQWWPDNFAWTPNGSPVYKLEWVSDWAVTASGAQWNYVKVICLGSGQTTVAQVRPITKNTRYDGVFVNDDDVYYFSISVPSNRRLIISLDVNAASNGPLGQAPDFDLFASTTTSKPDNSNYQWRAYHSNQPGTLEAAGEGLVIPTSTLNRTVYIGVHNHSGQGHFSIRGNLADANSTLTICTQDKTPAQVVADPGWGLARDTIVRTVVRNFQATHGNLFTSNVILKLQSTGLHTGFDPNKPFCEGDSACDWCMTGYSISTSVPSGDGCGYQASPISGRVRIPHVRCHGSEADPAQPSSRNYDHPANMSKVLAHESGHGLARMAVHQDVGPLLADQYDAEPTEDAHTLMNGPLDIYDSGFLRDVDSAYRYSTTLNHCQIGDPQQTFTPFCSQATSDWSVIQNSQWISSLWTFPDQTKSAQPWLRAQANVWLRDVITITAQ